MNENKTICEQAQEITTKARRDEYGHPADDFKRIAALWSMYLGYEITAKQVAIMQILLKISRTVHSPNHWDSMLDVAGYANCWGMIRQREIGEAKPKTIYGKNMEDIK